MKITYFYRRCAWKNDTRSVSGNVCACPFWTVNSRYTFQTIKRILFFWLFCKRNCNFEQCIRIRCIELYMGTWFKQKNQHCFEHFQTNPRSVNNFRTEHLGRYFWDFWSPYVAEASLGRGYNVLRILDNLLMFSHIIWRSILASS